jgi:hypothetical protein
MPSNFLRPRGLPGFRPRLNGPDNTISNCQKGRVWRRVENEDGVYVVELNPQAGPEVTDSVVFPAIGTEGASSRMMINTAQSAVRGGRVTGTQWDSVNRGDDSVAFGFDNVASGDASTVPGGGQNTASGDASFAAGVQATASHRASFVWSDSVSMAASTADNEVTFGSSGGFKVLGVPPVIPVTYNPGEIFLDAVETVVTGKLTVHGIIDPTGLEVVGRPAVPPTVPGPPAGSGTYWVRDDVPTTPIFTDDAGTDFQLNMGALGAGAFANLPVPAAGAGVTLQNTTAPGYDDMNDFVFGSPTLDQGAATGDIRFLFDKAKGAFRAGEASAGQWDSASRGTNSTAFGLSGTASGVASTIGGGSGNFATADDSTVVGGNTNTAGGLGSTVAGGANNQANGDYSFAAGDTSVIAAANNNCFVWSDATPRTATVARTDEVTFGAAGGFVVHGNGGSVPPYARVANGTVYLDADTVVTGKLTVTGAVDLTLMTMTPQTADPSAPGFGNYWTNAAGDAVYTSPALVETVLAGPGAGIWDIDTAPTPNVVRTDNSFIPGGSSLNDFVFGSQQLDDAGAATSDARFLFDKSLGAFRAGSATGGEWDAGVRGATSMGWGLDCTSQGAESTAGGKNCQALAPQSIALGDACVASGSNSVALGFTNTASGTNSFAVGNTNVASGNDSVAMGDSSDCNSLSGAFCFSGSNTGITAASANSFSCRFTGGYRFFSNATTAGPSISAGGADWVASCDRNLKENIVPLEGVLERLEQIPIYEYNFIGAEKEQLCRGPMAQDWNPQFVHNGDQLTISNLDSRGVALAGVKELHALVKTAQSERDAAVERADGLEERVAKLEALIAELVG